MAPSPVALLIGALAVAGITSVGADSFLGARISTDQVEQQFRSELRALLGRTDADGLARLERLQADIRPMFSALPKNADGSLERGTVRYALHRFFVQQHGWYVRGLEVRGGDKETDGSASVLEDRIPSYVLQLLEQYHGSRTGLRELAVLAATLEDVVHSEAIDILSTVYQAQDLDVQQGLVGDTEHRIIQTYLLFHIMPNPRYVNLTAPKLNQLLKNIPRFYTGWADTLMWAEDLRETVDYEEHTCQNPFTDRAVRSRDFNSVVRLVEGVKERYGTFQNLECNAMKNRLLELSDGSGRVRLSRFYEGAFTNTSQHFSESPDYLRHLGVLDETDPKTPTVILANYIYARGNCVACSDLYSICCIDACEGLLASLEKSIASPLADPQQVAELVAALPSGTVSVPRNLSAPMLRRLGEIAGRHGGSIPLHGRLFAQWLHHAFPNECPFPHVTGSLATPMSPQEWLRAEREGGRRLKASAEEMSSFIEAAPSLNATEELEAALDAAELLPWTEDEELVAALPVTPTRWSLAIWLRVAPIALGLVSVAVGLARSLRSTSATVSLVPGFCSGLRTRSKGDELGCGVQFV